MTTCTVIVLDAVLRPGYLLDPYYSSDGGQSSPPRQTSRAADSPGYSCACTTTRSRPIRKSNLPRSTTRTADYRRLAIILA